LLSLTIAQKKIAIGSFLGWSLDGYDIVLMLLVIPSISQLFFPSSDPVFSILATFASYTVTLIMRPLGSVIFGIYGDKFGRKKSMLVFVFASIPLPLIALYLMSSVSKELVPVALGINIMIGAIILIIPTLLSRETKDVDL
jgi:MFS family permease